MLLGTAATDVTPPVGVMLSGSTRRRPSVREYDPLLCKAMVLQSQDTVLAVVTLDLVALYRDVSDGAKAAIKRETGIPASHVLVTCSHTHSGPYTIDALDPDERPDPAYLARVQSAITDTVVRASASKRQVTMGCATTALSGIGANRRLLRPDGDAINAWLASGEERETLPPAGPVDENMVAWVFFENEKPVAALWNYTLHVNTHFGDGFSADYPGRAAEALKAAFGDGFFAAFIPGACGDINLRQGLSFESAHPLISAALVELVHAAQPGGPERLAAAQREIILSVRDDEPFQEEEIRAKWPSAFDVFEKEHEVLAARGWDQITTVIQALRIGDGAIACTPGEAFAKLGLDIKAASPWSPTVVAELCNDYVGYIPTCEAYDQGGYECFRARTAQLSPGSGEAIAEALVGMLSDLGQCRPARVRLP